MSHRSTTFRITLAAAAVAAAFPMANVANAQTLNSASCNRLLVLVDEAGDGDLRPDFIDARDVATADDADQCSLYVARVAQVGSITTDGAAAQVQRATDDAAQVESTDEATETVQIKQEATIEGEVRVTLPNPQVDIEQSPADISVRDSAPDVTIDQAQPKIVVRQAQPIIKVQMAQPTITVEQPAPEIIITMPDPGVNVASAQPQVEVNIPEPRVTVRQGEPQLNVDLAANMGDEADNDPGLERTDEDGTMVVSKAGMSSADLAPRIQYVASESQPNVTINSAEPDVQYVAADPQVQFEQGGEPKIDIISSGEPKITIQDADDDSAQADTAQPAVAAVAPAAPVAPAPVAPEQDTLAVTEVPAGQADAEVPAGQRDPSDAFAADPSDVAYDDTPSQAVSVRDLDGLDVINGRGEELGEVGRIVQNGQDTYMIVEHGGWFFGLNDKEVAFPLANVMVRGDNVVLRGMTEEQIRKMPDYDFGNEVDLGVDDQVEVMRVE